MKILDRPRRLRSLENIRELVAESSLSSADLIYPMFAHFESDAREEISSMPGRFRLGRHALLKEIKKLEEKGLKAICLFPLVEEKFKDSKGSYSYSEKNYYLDLLKEIKDRFPELVVMTDVALDPYSTDGHDGIVDPKTGEIFNDETLKVLSKMSVAQAKAGADIIGPSDMMDSRIKVIRESLEENNFKNTLIMSYSAKYASHFYGPFRDALDSAPKSGDKKTYQLDFRNKKIALKEARMDLKEGADILMVKPGIAYLDIVSLLARNCAAPISVYQVSGEYSMIKAAGEKGWVDEKQVMLESLMAFKRAGASMILSYFTPEALDYFQA